MHLNSANLLTSTVGSHVWLVVNSQHPGCCKTTWKWNFVGELGSSVSGLSIDMDNPVAVRMQLP